MKIDNTLTMNKTCSFCDPATINKQEIATLGTIRISYPRCPIIPAQVLIMPVRCVEHIHDLTEEEIADCFRAVKKLHTAFEKIFATTGYNLFANDGKAAGQHVPHVHFHIYGRSKDEAINPFEILNDREKYQNREQMSKEVYAANMANIRECTL